MKNIKLLTGILFTVLLCSFVPADWVMIESRDAGFRAAFPRRPEGTEIEGAGGSSPIITRVFMHDVGKYKDDNILYGVVCAEYADTLISSEFKDGIIEKFLTKTINKTVDDMDGTRLSEIKINYKEYPGRRLKVKYMNGKTFMYMQVYLIKNKVYTLKVACDVANDNNPSIDKFLTSFAALD
jgi:hypothetical protein